MINIDTRNLDDHYILEVLGLCIAALREASEKTGDTKFAELSDFAEKVSNCIKELPKS